MKVIKIKMLVQSASGQSDHDYKYDFTVGGAGDQYTSVKDWLKQGGWLVAPQAKQLYWTEEEL